MQMSSSIETATGGMIVKRVSVPFGLEELMEGLTKEVLLKKPKDIYLFASEYCSRLLALRDQGLHTATPKQLVAKKMPLTARTLTKAASLKERKLTKIPSANFRTRSKIRESLSEPIRNVSKTRLRKNSTVNAEDVNKHNITSSESTRRTTNARLPQVKNETPRSINNDKIKVNQKSAKKVISTAIIKKDAKDQSSTEKLTSEEIPFNKVSVTEDAVIVDAIDNSNLNSKSENDKSELNSIEILDNQLNESIEEACETMKTEDTINIVEKKLEENMDVPITETDIGNNEGIKDGVDNFKSALDEKENKVEEIIGGTDVNKTESLKKFEADNQEIINKDSKEADLKIKDESNEEVVNVDKTDEDKTTIKTETIAEAKIEDISEKIEDVLIKPVDNQEVVNNEDKFNNVEITKDVNENENLNSELIIKQEGEQELKGNISKLETHPENEITDPLVVKNEASEFNDVEEAPKKEEPFVDPLLIPETKKETDVKHETKSLVEDNPLQNQESITKLETKEELVADIPEKNEIKLNEEHNETETDNQSIENKLSIEKKITEDENILVDPSKKIQEAQEINIIEQKVKTIEESSTENKLEILPESVTVDKDKNVVTEYILLKTEKNVTIKPIENISSKLENKNESDEVKIDQPEQDNLEDNSTLENVDEETQPKVEEIKDNVTGEDSNKQSLDETAGSILNNIKSELEENIDIKQEEDSLPKDNSKEVMSKDSMNGQSKEEIDIKSNTEDVKILNEEDNLPQEIIKTAENNAKENSIIISDNSKDQDLSTNEDKVEENAPINTTNEKLPRTEKQSMLGNSINTCTFIKDKSETKNTDKKEEKPKISAKSRSSSQDNIKSKESPRVLTKTDRKVRRIKSVGSIQTENNKPKTKNKNNIKELTKNEESAITKRNKRSLSADDKIKNKKNIKAQASLDVSKLKIVREETLKTKPKISKSNIFTETQAALKIQTIWRGHKLRRQKQLHVDTSAILLQKIWRGFKVRKLHNRRLMFGETVIREDPVAEEIHANHKSNSALKIQSLWRGYKARKDINGVRTKLALIDNDNNYLSKDEEMLNAATKIQARIRGFLQRKKFKNKLNNTLQSIDEEKGADKKLQLDENVNVALQQLENIEIPANSPEIKLNRSKTVEEPEIIKEYAAQLIKAFSFTGKEDNNNNNTKLLLTSIEQDVSTALKNIKSQSEINQLQNEINTVDDAKTNNENISRGENVTNNVDKTHNAANVYENAPTRPLTSNVDEITNKNNQFNDSVELLEMEHVHKINEEPEINANLDKSAEQTAETLAALQLKDEENISSGLENQEPERSSAEFNMKQLKQDLEDAAKLSEKLVGDAVTEDNVSKIEEKVGDKINAGNNTFCATKLREDINNATKEATNGKITEGPEINNIDEKIKEAKPLEASIETKEEIKIEENNPEERKLEILREEIKNSSTAINSTIENTSTTNNDEETKKEETIKEKQTEIPNDTANKENATFSLDKLKEDIKNASFEVNTEMEENTDSNAEEKSQSSEEINNSKASNLTQPDNKETIIKDEIKSSSSTDNVEAPNKENIEIDEKTLQKEDIQLDDKSIDAKIEKKAKENTEKNENTENNLREEPQNKETVNKNNTKPQNDLINPPKEDIEREELSSETNVSENLNTQTETSEDNLQIVEELERDLADATELSNKLNNLVNINKEIINTKQQNEEQLQPENENVTESSEESTKNKPIEENTDNSINNTQVLNKIEETTKPILKVDIEKANKPLEETKEIESVQEINDPNAQNAEEPEEKKLNATNASETLSSLSGDSTDSAITVILNPKYESEVPETDKNPSDTKKEEQNSSISNKKFDIAHLRKQIEEANSPTEKDNNEPKEIKPKFDMEELHKELSLTSSESDVDDAKESRTLSNEDAATRIQSAYRGYRVRRDISNHVLVNDLVKVPLRKLSDIKEEQSVESEDKNQIAIQGNKNCEDLSLYIGNKEDEDSKSDLYFIAEKEKAVEKAGNEEDISKNSNGEESKELTKSLDESKPKEGERIEENLKDKETTSNGEINQLPNQNLSKEIIEGPTIKNEDNNSKKTHLIHQETASTIKPETPEEEKPKAQMFHTGEFHDTVVIPLQFSNASSSTQTQSRTNITLRNDQENAVIPLQLNETTPGSEISTMTRASSSSADDFASDVVGNFAQAFNKDALPLEHGSANKSSPPADSSMESDKRNNATLSNGSNSTINEKNMEIQAATKIQAGFRGYQVRKQLKNKNNASTETPTQRRSGRRKSSGKADTKPKEAEIEEKSAVKIQAGIRGFLVRRRQKKQKNVV